MRAGGERRGSNADRARRKAWLLAAFDVDLGPSRVRCHLGISDACVNRAGEFLTLSSVTADRIVAGGSYCHDNVQPACRPCQSRQGALITAERRRQWLEWRREADDAGIVWDGAL